MVSELSQDLGQHEVGLRSVGLQARRGTYAERTEVLAQGPAGARLRLHWPGLQRRSFEPTGSQVCDGLDVVAVQASTSDRIELTEVLKDSRRGVGGIKTAAVFVEGSGFVSERIQGAQRVGRAPSRLQATQYAPTHNN